MSNLPAISGKKLFKILKNQAYLLLRQKGSHCFVTTSDKKFTTIIPVHGNEDLSRGLFLKILKELNCNLNDLNL